MNVRVLPRMAPDVDEGLEYHALEQSLPRNNWFGARQGASISARVIESKPDLEATAPLLNGVVADAVESLPVFTGAMEFGESGHPALLDQLESRVPLPGPRKGSTRGGA